MNTDKYGLTDKGIVVTLPSDSKIIWVFFTYPPKELSDDVYRVFKES